MASQNAVYHRQKQSDTLHAFVKQNDPIPQPGPGQVLLKVHALSLNFRDVMIRKGIYPGALPSGVIPISDGAGVVEAVGDGVSKDWIGKKVTPNFSRWVDGEVTVQLQHTALGGDVDGLAGQYVLAWADSLVPIAKNLSFEEAATLPCAALTAWNALFEGTHPVKAGDTVLIEGTGGVSVFGLQFAVAAGAKVILTSSADDKLKKGGELGAWKLVNYKTNPDWNKEVLSFTGGKGVDHIVEVGGKDAVGKATSTARFGGHIHVVGGVSGFDGTYSIGEIVMKGLTVRGVLIGSVKMFERMNSFIEKHNIKPQIDKTFDFDHFNASVDYLEGGKHFGKVVVKVSH